MTELDHDALMVRACELARKGLESTSPNPRVGCVLISDDGQVVGEGWHERAGEAHAEVAALNNAGDRALGSTAIVTLEPCSHQGRTGACSEALIRAGVERVVYGMQDPNPLVSGKGLERLRAAGVEVVGPVQPALCHQLNVGFIKRMSEGLPWLRCKMAMSLDGRTAMASGESQWITGVDARQRVQRLRAQSCAVMTGAGTVIADNPRLNVRSDSPSAVRQPLRVVLDGSLKSAADANIFWQDGESLLVTDTLKEEQAKNKYGAPALTILPLPAVNGRIPLLPLLQLLAQRQCNEVLLEAGPTLLGSFMEAGLVDELVLFVAPKLLGSDARPLLQLPLTSMSDSVALHIDSVEPVGVDLCITARPVKRAANQIV